MLCYLIGAIQAAISQCSPNIEVWKKGHKNDYVRRTVGNLTLVDQLNHQLPLSFFKVFYRSNQILHIAVEVWVVAYLTGIKAG